MSNKITPEVASKLAQSIKHLPPGACFIRCRLASFTEITLRCSIAMPERSVRFLVLVSSIRDERGDIISADQPIQAWQNGWVLGELAGNSHDSRRWKIVRVRQSQAYPLEVEVEENDVVS